MASAGTPLDEGLDALGQALGGGDGRALAAAALAVRGGASMSETLPRCLGLDDVERALLVTADRAGRWPTLLERLAERSETLVDVRGKLLSALAWPALTLLMAAAMIPFPELIKHGVGAYIAGVTAWVGGIGAAGVALFVGAPALWRVPAFRGGALAVAGLVPGLSRLANARRLSLLFGALGPALDAGLPIGEALALSGKATGEPRVGARLSAMGPALQDGGDLVQLLAGVPGMDPGSRARVASGVRTGRLADACLRLARDHAEASRRATEVFGAFVRFGLTLLVSMAVAGALMEQMQQLLTNPLSMVPGAEGDELQRELRKVLPSLGM